MIKHVVMWKLNDFAEGSDAERNSKRMKIELESLKKTIQQIGHIEVGINMIKDPPSCHGVLNSVFKNQQDLELYKKHPDHRAVAKLVSKVVDDRVVVDFEKRPLVKQKVVPILYVRLKADYDADSVVIPGAEWWVPDNFDEWRTVPPKD